MLEVFLKVNDKLTVKAEGTTLAETFSSLSKLQQVFSHSDKCGCCGSPFIFVERKVVDGKKEYTYFECRCTNTKCRAKILYGQGDGGEIYPKRKYSQLSDNEKEQRKDEKDHADSHFGYLPNNGWFKYRAEKKEE